VLSDVLANNFEVRAKHIARDIKKKKIDLVGLQEAALWKLQTPTDGSGLNPAAQRALNPVVDYIDELLEELNRKAKTAGECKKQGIPKSKCFRGYKLVIAQQEADLEFLGDFDNNPGPNGTTCDLSSGTCPPPPGSNSWTTGNDDTGVNLGEPPSPPFPPDSNFDNPPFNGAADAPGAQDCAPGAGDTNPSASPNPPFPSPFDQANNPVCMFHGIDGDLSLTMRDAILKRKGAGVKTRNSRSSNFANILALPLFGGQAEVEFTRGWTATDARVRGKRFTFVNTHLESESEGSIREDQASELIAPGGPASGPRTIIVGDLNSDPNRAPANLPDGDGGSNIAINRLFAAGFTSLVTTPGIATGSHGDHGDVINDPNDLLGEGWIDHILTNSPAKLKRKGKAIILDGFEDGLWQSDHAGVLVRIKGKKR